MKKTPMSNYPDGIYHAKSGSSEYLLRVENGESKECFHLPITNSTSLSKSSSFWNEWGTYTPATYEQETWLKTCIEKGHFLPLSDIELKPKVQDNYEIF